MKKAFILLLLLPLGNFLLAENHNQKVNNDIGIVAGFNFPMYKDAGEGVVVGLTYSNWANSGLGFRTGFQYTSNVAHVDYVIGTPVAVTYRTKVRSLQRRLSEGAYSAAKSATDYGQDDYADNVRNTFFSFLAGLFSNAEFFAGITPGYILGNDSPTRSSITSYSKSMRYWENSWTEVRYHFSTSLDAGMNLNFGIWRFDLKLMPAFHFNITDNFVIHTSQGNSKAGETSSTS